MSQEYVAENIKEPRRTPSGKSLSSSSTLSGSGIKRRRMLNYLQGEGAIEWTPQTRLVLGEVDVTSALEKYRKKNFKIAEKSNDLSNMKLLSLSHIFPINNIDEDKCITKHLDEDTKTVMHDILYEEVVLEKASAEAVMFCKGISERIEGDFEPCNELDRKIKACCFQLKNIRSQRIEGGSEASFMNKHLLPNLNEVFWVNPQKHIVYAMIDSAEKSGATPDWKLGYKKHNNKSLYVFFIEVKCLGQTSKYQAEDDYVKLMKEMKDSLDQQIDFGFDSPFSFGLLVKGFRCVLYMMKIIEEGLYIPIMIKKFSLVEEVEDAVSIPAMVESLMFVKEKMADIDRMFKKRSRAKPLKDFMKPSFRTEFN